MQWGMEPKLAGLNIDTSNRHEKATTESELSISLEN
jgi:hypothetical protein